MADEGVGVLDGIGAFRWWPSDDRWTWNEALFRLHGYEPGEVAPTRTLLLAHAHPQDRDRVADAVTALALHRRPFCLRYRVVSENRPTREVVGAGGPSGRDSGDGALLGYVIPLDADLGAPPLTDGVLPGPTEVVIPVPRGREGTGPAEPVAPHEAAGEAAVPAVRSGEPADARHAALLRRAHDTLVSGLELTREAAAALVAWLANTHEVPPVIVAESLAGLDCDETGRPDLAALLAVLDDGPAT